MDLLLRSIDPNERVWPVQSRLFVAAQEDSVRSSSSRPSKLSYLFRRGVVGFLGFQYDRKLALSALSLSSSKDDIHGVFAGLVLMTYLGVVLLLGGYQADEKRILLDYKTIVDK